MPTPLDYFRQHHELDPPRIDEHEFRPFYRVRTRCDQLLHDRAITFAEWRAAYLYRAVGECALAASLRTQRFVVEPRGTSDAALARRIEAIAIRSRLMRELGPWAIQMLDLVCLEDRSWRALGQFYSCHPRTARAWAIVVLRGLRGAL